MIEFGFQVEQHDGGRSFSLRVGDAAQPVRLQAPLTAVFGASGAGKSTLLGCLAGTTAGASGRLSIDGDVPVDTAAGLNPPPEKRRVGLVFQNGRLFPHLTVERNLVYGWRRLSRERQATVDRESVIELLALQPVLRQRPRHLSGGEQQRVAIGRALLAAPRLLLLDEPVTALDHQSRDTALATIRTVADETGVPVVLVTHDPQVVRALAHDVLVLDAGQVVAQGDPFAVLDHPRSLGVASLAGLANVFADATVIVADEQSLQLELAPGVRLAAPAMRGVEVGQVVGVGVAAHDIILAAGDLDAARLSTRNVIAGRIASLSEPTAGRVLATVAAADGCQFRVALVPATVAELQLAVDLPVTLLIKATAVHVMHHAPS